MSTEPGGLYIIAETECLWRDAGAVPDFERAVGQLDEGDVVMVISTEQFTQFYEPDNDELQTSDYLKEVRIMTRIGPGWLLTRSLCSMEAYDEHESL
jgi:hypothetical protein